MKNTMKPEITVLMAVYNAEAYVAEAVKSVLEQTYSDFELLVVDDGSTDGTAKVVRGFKDARIRYVKRENDYIASLNAGMGMARGRYVARMDADDRMHPDRLRIQHAILEEDTGIDVCGSWATPFGAKVNRGEWSMRFSGYIAHPLVVLSHENFLCHPTVMFRTSFWRQKELRYEPGYPYAEDYKLWLDIARKGGRFYIESQSLLLYRVTDGQQTNRHWLEQTDTSERIRREAIAALIAGSGTQAEVLNELYERMLRLEEEWALPKELLSNCFHRIFGAHVQQESKL